MGDISCGDDGNAQYSFTPPDGTWSIGMPEENLVQIPGVEDTYGADHNIGMHELAHTVGLAHVRAKAQIMFPKATRKPATWGAGDWHGLRKQGRRAGCL